MWKHVRKAAIGLLTGFALLIQSEVASARIGDNFENVKGDKFFEYFGGSELQASELPAGQSITLHPKGTYTPKMVALYMKLGPERTVDQLDLVMDRAFLEGEEWVKGRDIVLNFLRENVAVEDESALLDLMNEIEYPQDKGVVYNMTIPTLPVQQTVGYRVFQGKMPSFQHTGKKSIVKMENLDQDGRRLLRLTVQTSDNYRKLFLVHTPPER